MKTKGDIISMIRQRKLRGLLQVGSILSILLLFSVNAYSQSTSWTGTTNVNWTTSSNWTNGVPNQNLHAVIGDASFTGSNQPTLNSGTLKCKSLTLGSGTKASTLTVAKNFIVYGDLTIGSNGTLSHTSKKLVTVQGDWLNNGTYTATKNGSRVAFSGTACSLTGATTFKDLTIYAGCTVTLGSNIVVNSDFDCYGILNPTASYVVSGSADLDVERNGSIQVHASTFAGNYTISSVDIDARGEVNYASSSITQTVSSAYKYGILRISGGSTKELAANLPDIHSGSSTRGRVYVDAGIFDLKGFTCDRTSNGGYFVVAGNAELWIGGTGDFPDNFATVSLAASSTVSYYGNNQTVKNLDYGNLILTGTSGTVTKTMPTGTLNIYGDFSMEIGSATTVSATVAGNLVVDQNVIIEEDCTLGLSTFTHSFYADLENEGTLTGSTSLVQFYGAQSFITGLGSFDFNHLYFLAAGIYSDASLLSVDGNLYTSSGSSFEHLGGIVEMTGTAVILVGDGFVFFDLETSGTVAAYGYVEVAGDLIVDGTLIAYSNAFTISGPSSDTSGTGVLEFNALEITGDVTTDMDFSIKDDFGIAIPASFNASAGEITFKGVTEMSGEASLYDVTISITNTLSLGANSVLNVGNVFTNSGTFNTTNSIPNKVQYTKNGAQDIAAETYYNLVLATGGTKTPTGTVTVNNDITINTGVTLSASTYTMNINRHWYNNGTFTAGTSNIQFVGSNAARISGATTFNTLTVNKSANTIEVLLLDDIIASSVTMTTGFMNTDVNSISATSTRTGNGIIIGTIIHDHAIANGTTYYFEGPNNGLTFSNPTSLNKVTLKVTPGEVNNVDPLVESVTREYQITIPVSASYDSVLMRLHYEDNELNAFVEPNIAIYKYNTGTTWDSLGFTSRDVANNYVELQGITDVDGYFMMSGPRNVVRWNGLVSSDWSNASNWTSISGASLANRVPDSGDVARIGDTLFVNQPIISTQERINVLRFGDTKAATITLNGGNLNVDGSVRGNWSTNRSHQIDVDDDTLTIGTTLTLSDGVSLHDIELIINNGLADIQYDIVQNTTSKVTFTGSGNLQVSHDYEYIAGTFTPNVGTVTYTGGLSQSLAPLSYYNLTIDKSTSRVSAESPTQVSNNLETKTGGEFLVLDTLTIGNDITIGASTEVFEFNTLIQVGRNWSNSGNFEISGGTVEFNGAIFQVVDGNTFNNLVVNKPSGVLGLAGDLIIENNISVLSGSLDLNARTANRSVVGGSLTIDSGTTVLIGGASNFPGNFLTQNIDTHSTVIYDGAIDQSVLPITYGNLVLSNGSPNEKTLERGISILGDLTINTATILNPDTSTIKLYGNLSNSGSVNPGTSTFILNGIGKTITGSTDLYNVSVVDGSYTVASGTISMSGDLNLESTGSLSFGTNTAILDGNLTNYGTLTSNGTATFTGTREQHISLFSAITSSSTGIINFNGTIEPVINSTSSPSFATVNINNTAGITASVPWTIAIAMNIGSGSTFDGGALTHTFYGDFDNDGSVLNSGKLFFTPGAPYSSGATISLLGTSFTSVGEVEFGGSVPITLSGASGNFENLIISNSDASGITAPSSWVINNDLQISSGAIFNAGTSTAHTIGENLVNNGTLNGQTSEIEFVGDTVSIDGVGANNFEDIKVNSATLLKLNNDIIINSDLIVDGALDSSGSTIEFQGSAASTITGTATSVSINQLKTTKSGGAETTLEIPVYIRGNLQLDTGNFVTDATNLLIINDNATASSGNDLSFVHGPMKKIGNDTFDFPLGDSVIWARLGISAPSATTDEFTAQYFFQGYTDTLTMAATPTPALNNVSSMEYWTCDRTVGTSNVTVKLHWENKYLSGIDSANSDLVVARWNGTAWENAGQTAAQGDFSGSVTSSTVTSFSPFTLGSLNFGFNYLPVEFLHFDASLNKEYTVDLFWETASEINNDYFVVERSTNGTDFVPLEQLDGAGNSSELQEYKTVDYNPSIGLNYYRVKQVDFDGNFDYSDIKSVRLERETDQVLVYPNPAKNEVNVKLKAKSGKVLVYSQYGVLIDSKELANGICSFNIANYSKGLHLIVIEAEGKKEVRRFIKL